MKKWISTAFFILAIIFVLSGCNQKSFSIDRVTIHSDVLPDGGMEVKELYLYNFHGSFKGATRTIHSDISGFKAYSVGANVKNPFNTADAKPLKTEKDSENDDTYKIYAKSKDKKRYFLYTYKVKNVVKKFQDAAFINYSFFDRSNKTALHDLSIRYQFPKALQRKDLTFLHDYTGKAALKAGDKPNTAIYHIGTLPEKRAAEVHFLLNPSMFPEKMTDSKSQKYEALKQNEEHLQYRLSHRENRLAEASRLLLIGSGILLLIVFILFLIKYVRTRDRQADESCLGEMDPLYAHFLHHRLVFTDEAVTAGLLSLVSKKYVKLENVPIKQKYREDHRFPDETLRFTLLADDVTLSKPEKYLVSWLFTEMNEDKRSFTLDALYGPTKMEKKDLVSKKLYEKKSRKFKSKFSVWKNMLKQEPEFSRNQFIKPLRFFPIPAFLLAGGFGGVAGWLYYIDGMTKGALIGLSIVLSILLIIGFSISYAGDRFKAGFYVYFFAALISLCFLHDHAAILTGWIFGLTAAVLFMLIPNKKWMKEKAGERYLLKSWARRIKKQTSAPVLLSKEMMEHLIYIAIVLKVSREYLAMHREKHIYKELEMVSPVFQNPDTAALGFDPSFYIFAAAADSGSSSSSSSSASTGGGGAGAF